MKLTRYYSKSSDEAKRAKQKEENKKEDLKKDLETYQKGIAGGTMLGGLGGLSYGIGKVIEKEDAKRVARGITNNFPADKLKALKRNGKIIAGVSVPLIGYSAYKYRKTKKELKDDNKA